MFWKRNEGSNEKFFLKKAMFQAFSYVEISKDRIEVGFKRKQEKTFFPLLVLDLSLIFYLIFLCEGI